MNDVKKKLVELLKGKSIDLESDAEYVADLLIENGVTILPEGAIVLTRAEIEALNEYQKKLNEGVITNTENKSNNSADMSNKQIEDRAEWISVEDRLPNPSEKCVVALKVGNEMEIDLGERVPCYDLQTKERYCEWLITYDWDEGQGCEITHWLPLPQPPKMKGDNNEQR